MSIVISAIPMAEAHGQLTDVSSSPNDLAFPTERTILDRAIERASTQDDSGIELAFEYIVESTVESINGDGDVTETETSRLRRYPLEGLLYDELIEQDGRPLEEDDLRKEKEKKSKFIREARAHAARGEPYEPDEMNMRFDRELMDRYNTRLVGTDIIRGLTCWVLSFEPRNGRLPDNRRMDKALNRSVGRLWIAQDDFGVARISFEMQRPFRYLWGLIATLRHATGDFDFERIDDNVWIPKSFDLELDLRVFFRNMRRHIRQDWIEHRPIGGF